MPLGNLKKATYISVKDGRLVTKNEDGLEAAHDFLEGTLVDVTLRTKEFGREKVTSYLLEFHDEAGERLVLSLGEKSGVARSVLNSLASVSGNFGKVRIVAYVKDGYSKVVVYNNSERLAWKYPEIPPVEERVVEGLTIKDDSKRVLFFRALADSIRAKAARTDSAALADTF